MDSSPITPPDPYEAYRVERAQEEQRRSFEGGGYDGKPPKWGLAAYFLKLLHRLADLFIVSKEHVTSETLVSLKKAFEMLEKEDLSEDIQFLNQLSKIWQALLEMSLKKDEVKTLVQKIQNYPEHEKHTLGYYLSEYAGQKWIPFPYMDLIQKIHSEHQKNPEGSAITEWTQLIDQLLSKMK